MLDELSQLKKHSSRPQSNRNVVLEKIKNYLNGIDGSAKYQPRFPLRQILFSYIGSFIGIAALAYISVNTDYPLIAAPFGAAAVLLFAVPESPLAQPRNCIFGNCLGAIVSLVMVHVFGSEPWVMALAVATAIQVMQLTKTLHPPGGAVALVGVMSKAEWSFLFTPVLAGSIVLVICTTVFNNSMPGRSYPKHWL
ncbi:MAG: HPP family protein [Hydrococcus sp. Prado102]|nr:HPP family protein [Hydrococcus sp. Prado102]